MPKGKPIDDNPRKAATVTLHDEGEARAWARKHLPRPFERLSEAGPISTEHIKELRRANNLPEL